MTDESGLADPITPLDPSLVGEDLRALFKLFEEMAADMGNPDCYGHDIPNSGFDWRYR